MGRPRKNPIEGEFTVTGADPVLRNAEGLSPADEVVVLTKEQIVQAMEEPRGENGESFSDVGMVVKITDKHWLLRLGNKLANSGSLAIPLEDFVNCAQYLYVQVSDVSRMANAQKALNKLGAKFNYGMGEILGKDGLPV